MTKILKILFFLAPILIGSCKKESLITYETSDNIYFYYAPRSSNSSIVSYRDTAQVNFGRRPAAMEDSVVFFVNVLGNIADTKRAFTMEVDANRSTALLDVHYQLPPVDSLYISENSVSKRMVVKIFRPASLRDTVVDLYLNLLPNEFFQTNLPLYNYNASNELRATVLRIVMDDRLPKPIMWDDAYNAVGTYSRRKLELLVRLIGFNINRFYEPTYYTASQLSSYGRYVQAYLNTQKSLGNTVYEDDGSEMVMGPAAQ